MTDTWVGIDVAKDELVVGIAPNTTRQVANDDRGVRELLAKLVAVGTLMMLEATGGYELALVAALEESPLPVVVVNLRQVRDFAKATGELAKPDTLDALALGRFAEPAAALRPVAADEQQALEALVTRRRQVLERLQAKKSLAGQSRGLPQPEPLFAFRQALNFVMAAHFTPSVSLCSCTHRIAPGRNVPPLTFWSLRESRVDSQSL